MSTIEDRIAHLERSVDPERLDRIERTLRSLEIDMATIIQMLRARLLPDLLRDRPAYVRHGGAWLDPETRRLLQRKNAEIARASKAVGRGKGAVRTPATKQALGRRSR